MRELNHFVRQDITVSLMYADKAYWIATAAMLAGSAISSLIGGSKAKRAARKAQRELTYRKNAEKAWYEKEYNTDYLDTKAGQNLMRKAQEVQDRYIKRAEGAAAVGGGTDAAVATAKEQANKAIGDTIADVAAQDTARKQRVADQHMSNVNNLSQQQQEIEQSKADATTQAAQGMSNALMQGAMTLAGSQPNGVKSQSNSDIGKSPTVNDNTHVAQNSVSAPNNVPSLDEAVGISHRKEQRL